MDQFVEKPISARYAAFLNSRPYTRSGYTSTAQSRWERNNRWPKRGDRLLKDAVSWTRGVDFPSDERLRNIYIWDGYMLAGHFLIDACQNDPQQRSALIYPILFNYRHGIEIAMKWIIERYGCYANVDATDIEHHDLWQLWKRCRTIIGQTGSDENALRAVEQVIKDFHELDKNALTFRYSRNKDGPPMKLPEKIVDLENIRDVMDGLIHYFYGLDAYLDDLPSALD